MCLGRRRSFKSNIAQTSTCFAVFSSMVSADMVRREGLILRVKVVGACQRDVRVVLARRRASESKGKSENVNRAGQSVERLPGRKSHLGLSRSG